jgi:hypothetical protein
MELTGHPLVDTGMSIAALYNNRRTIAELTEADLRRAVQYLDSQIDPNKKTPGALNGLKILFAFWQNNPLAGHNTGKDGQNIPRYRSILQGVQQVRHRGCCQICGRHGVYIDANRSWLPLGASSDGDPCSLPNLSGKFICSICFQAVTLLPLGCKLVGNNPYLFHVIDPELQCEAIKSAFDSVASQIVARASNSDSLRTKTELTGRVALLEVVAGSRLWDQNQGGTLTRRSPTGATVIAFNNSGTSVAWNQLHLPAQALDFFAELDSAEPGHEGSPRHTFIAWAKFCEKVEYTDRETRGKRTNSYFDLLCDDVEQRRSIGNLLRGIVRTRTNPVFKKEEKLVLEMYERVALSKQERFDLLSRLADKIRNEMDERYRDSFRKRLANIRSREALLKLLKEYAHSERTNLRLKREELAMLNVENAGEVISLLYLLVVAEE